MTRSACRRDGADAADLRAEVRRLEVSSEPLTLSKIRSHLPAAHRSVSLEFLAESLQQLVDANVFYKYPPYRSQQDRYWIPAADRSRRPVDPRCSRRRAARLVGAALQAARLHLDPRGASRSPRRC